MESNNDFFVRNGELVVAVIAIVIAIAGGIAQVGEPVEHTPEPHANR
mgnify:CR=1 FL=1